MSIIVAFGHKARHGKDTAAKHLIEKYGSQYVMKAYSFAEQLKTAVFDLLLQPLDNYWGMDNYFAYPHPEATVFASVGEKLAWVNENKVALIPIMQKYGTEYIRAKDPFYWVRQVHAAIERDKPQIAIITDLRFKNEFLYVLSRKGYAVKVVREGFVAPDRDPNHQSEVDLDNVLFHYTISVQDGAIDELKSDVEDVFGRIVKAVTPEVAETDDYIRSA